MKKPKHITYLLSNVAFEENNISVALDAWTELSEKYPSSIQSKRVQDRI